MDYLSVKVGTQTMLSSDKEEMFICPYDPVHRIAAKRFVRHLVKCRKNNPTRDMSVCPFNARHVIPKPELRHHLSCCPDSRMIENELNYERYIEEGDEVKGDTSVPAIVTEGFDFGDNEDWDEEIKLSANWSSDVTTGRTAKPVNHRRDAIRKMKEELKRRVQDETSCTISDFEIVQRRPKKYPIAAMQQNLSQYDHILAKDPGKPQLAANFQKPPDCS